MDSMEILYLKRAENELVIAKKLMEMSEEEKTRDFMQIQKEMTFYSAVISHSYYSIFYSAKAILLSKGIKTQSPEIHRKLLMLSGSI